MTEILRKDRQEEGNESAVWDLVTEASERWQEDVGRERERESNSLALLTRVWYFLFLFFTELLH